MHEEHFKELAERFYLLKKGLTTPDDLRKIADILGLKIDYIGFGYNFD